MLRALRPVLPEVQVLPASEDQGAVDWVSVGEMVDEENRPMLKRHSSNPRLRLLGGPAEQIDAVIIQTEAAELQAAGQAAHAKWLKTGKDEDKAAFAAALLRWAKATRNKDAESYAEELRSSIKKGNNPQARGSNPPDDAIELIHTVVSSYGVPDINDGQPVIALRLGDVQFWIDSSGPFKDRLSYDRPMSRWNTNAIAKQVAQLLKKRGKK